VRHPFESIPTGKRRAIFIPLLVLTLAVMFTLNAVGAALGTEAAPLGIISYELAGDVPTAQAILDSWDAQARVRAGFSLGFDYLFLLLYSTAIAIACAWAAGEWRDRGRSWASFGLWLAWGQWLAALLDGVENAALWGILASGPVSPWPQVARWCAVVKFTLVIVGLLYATWGGAWAALGRVKRNTPR
jgi:hypothetical protein